MLAKATNMQDDMNVTGVLQLSKYELMSNERNDTT
jgi:hypothetical protein